MNHFSERLTEQITKQNNIYLEYHHIIHQTAAYIYWKDLDGNYLGRNWNATKRHQELKLESMTCTIDSIVGKSDYDVFTKETADFYRKNDISVMEKDCELIKEEPLFLPNGETIFSISSKVPLYHAGKMIGVIGTSIEITPSSRSDHSLAMTLKKLHKSVTNIQQFSTITSDRHISFTPREMDILQLLIQGKTAKGIARNLQLSARTVESYVEKLKLKMSATTKYDLIEKILTLLNQ